jgi:hypothetical protein
MGRSFAPTQPERCRLASLETLRVGTDARAAIPVRPPGVEVRSGCDPQPSLDRPRAWSPGSPRSRRPPWQSGPKARPRPEPPTAIGCRRVRRAQMCFGFSGGLGPTIRPRFQGTRVLVGTVRTSGVTGSWVEELVMRNPLLPMSIASNDGSLQHKPTFASSGPDRCFRPDADHQIYRKCRFSR